MTVLHLLGSPRHGGAETYFLDLLEALHRDGLPQAAAIHANADREAALAAMGVRTDVLPFHPPFDFSTGRLIRKLARELDARVLVQWMNRAGRVVPKTGPWARIGRLGGYYHLKYYRGADFLVGNTRDIVDYIVREGWPADRVDYIPNFAVPKDDPPVDRAELDTPDDAPLLLGMGRLHDDKAHDVSLTALVDLPGAYLWIAGAGPLEGQLKAQAKRLGVADRVRFLGWRLDASALYRTADICLFPSRFEPLGNTVIQAWAHGTPLIAAASQGPGAMIRHDEDALLVPVNDADALAKATRRLLDDPATGRRLAKAGRERIRTEFASARVTAQWRELFARYGEA
ncbi:glycosyltransferase [Caulobacter sp. S45]|uniref:glycosyltransferase n=1 Tax=Caulobacter sp. S45 TaxID=1641861 RepID=UPI00131B3022|nr:glycosyltransferase [Caulobacter sp. S45]